ALAANLLYGERGICGCWFTITLADSTESHLLLNGMIIAMSLIVWWDSRQSEEKSPAEIEDVGRLQAPHV
ncbi:MAG: hypothetical protein MI919_41785, partial [Holophagales bacterium]|nr:hypothetical protein [Holophagales bacterium]